MSGIAPTQRPPQCAPTAMQDPNLNAEHPARREHRLLTE